MRDIRTEVPAGYTFSLVLTLIYKVNYATADKTKHTLHALQRRCCHVSSRSCGGGVGCFILRVRGRLLQCPPSMTTQSRAVAWRYWRVSLEHPPRLRHCTLSLQKNTHTHTCSKEPTLALPPILQFCRISCRRGDNKPVLQRGQPRWKGLKLDTASGLAVWIFMSPF